MKQQFSDYGVNLKVVLIRCDNTSVILCLTSCHPKNKITISIKVDTFFIIPKGISILLGGVEYTLYLCEGEFDQSKFYLLLSFTTSLREVL